MQDKKVALVTGAAGNLGEVVVKKFIQENYTVIGTINKDNNSREENFESIVVDLTDEDASNKTISSIIEKHKKINAAILTVGGFEMNKIANTKTADIYKQYQLNFETAYNIAKPVFMQMMQQKSGRIFLIGSKPGLEAKNSKGMIAYGLSKSLLFRLAELMNDEAKENNVATYVIVPSTIDTPQNRESMPGSDFSKWVKPEIIADKIFQLAEQEAISDDYIIKMY